MRQAFEGLPLWPQKKHLAGAFFMAARWAVRCAKPSNLSKNTVRNFPRFITKKCVATWAKPLAGKKRRTGS